MGNAVRLSMTTHPSIDGVLAAFSHEARTPLAAIRGALALLSEQGSNSLDAGQLGLIDIATRNVRRTESLLAAVLESGRVGREEWPVDPIPVRLDRVARGAIAEARDGLPSRNATIEQDWSAELPLVPADPEGLRRILKNLVANALRFTAQHGRISIHGRIEGRQSVIEVCDTGPGVQASEREWVFGRFQQCRRDSGRRGGMGLGLYLSREIARSHGGELSSVEPPSGIGACFRLTLPLDVRAPRMPQTMSVVSIVEIARADQSPLRPAETFRIAEALRSAVPAARRWESNCSVSGVLPKGPAAEHAGVITRIKARLGDGFTITLARRPAGLVA